MKKVLLSIVVICLAVSACNAKSNQGSAALLGSWKLTSYGSAASPTPAVSGTEAGLTFKEDETVSGNSGCNGFGGNYKVQGDQVAFDQIVSTLMACDDPRMKQENVVQKVLSGTAIFKMEGNRLTLTNNDMVLVLEK